MALLTPATQSIIEGVNGTNRTGTGLSTSIIIRVNGVPVGAVKSINITETRNIDMISELGTDGHIDSVPKSSTSIEGGCTRIRFDRMRIAEAFSRGFIHVKSQRLPFDIDIYDRWNGDSNTTQIVTTLKNVWIKSISYTYDSDNWVISDTMQWSAEDISSTINGNNAATGGSRNLIAQTDAAGIERQTDRGLRRGSLDAPGLINAVFG